MSLRSLWHSYRSYWLHRQWPIAYHLLLCRLQSHVCPRSSIVGLPSPLQYLKAFIIISGLASQGWPWQSAGLHFGHSAHGLQLPLWLLFVICFLFSSSMILSQPTSDLFLPDTWATITHKLYSCGWFIHSHTHFVSNSLLFCQPTLSELFPLILG